MPSNFKKVLITGAAGLLGEKHSEVVAKFGGNLVLIDLYIDKLKKIKNNLKKKIFIKTLGCQMNEYDSNRILDVTKKINYFPTKNLGEANCYILNT